MPPATTPRWLTGIRARLKDAALRHIYRPVRGAVLDVGCGSGILLATLAGENPDMRLAGIDLAPEMIRATSERLGSRADIRQGDAEHLPWEDGQFDVVTCVNSFHRHAKPRRALSEMQRVLKFGGSTGHCRSLGAARGAAGDEPSESAAGQGQRDHLRATRDDLDAWHGRVRAADLVQRGLVSVLSPRQTLRTQLRRSWNQR